MRKRPILLAAVVAAAGLAALGTVVAQPPAGGSPPQPGGSYAPPFPPAGAGLGNGQTGGVPARVAAPAAGGTPLVRPFGDWSATPAPAGYAPPQPAGGYPVQPAGGYPAPGAGAAGTRPRLTAPGYADGGVRPASGVSVPPPSMDVESPPAIPPADAQPPAPQPPIAQPPIPPAPVAAPTVPTAPAMPPPSLSVEGTGARPPAPAGAGPLPSLPTTPVAPASNPKPFPTVPAAPAVTTAPAAAAPASLPGKVTQTVTLETSCPDSVVVNKELDYVIVVRNAGSAAVTGVRIEDELPAGVRYVKSDPPGDVTGDKLVWAVGTLEGNTDRRIVVTVRPTEEGEVRSRASVAYAAAADVRARVTRPRLAVVVTAPEVARAGDEARLVIRVSNTGTGPAENVLLKAFLSDGLTYKTFGNQLSSPLAVLQAGESKELPLPVTAIRAGPQWCQVALTADGSPDAAHRADLKVVEPQLHVAQTGPARCVVRSEPTYEITLSNPGSAPTETLTVRTVVPDGFEFVQASDGGTYTAAKREVLWRLAALPAGERKVVGVKMRAAAAGDVALRTKADATPEAAAAGAAKPVGRALEAVAETPIKAEGVAAVRFDVKGLENPVEVGKDAVYEIRVTNQGTSVCTKVQLMAAMADGATFSSASPNQVKAQGSTLVFEPIAALPVKGEMIYTVRVRSNREGDMRLRVQLTCDQIRTPMVKEESTSFYKQQ